MTRSVHAIACASPPAALELTIFHPPPDELTDAQRAGLSGIVAVARRLQLRGAAVTMRELPSAGEQDLS
jgi:hypothetical protein